MPDYRLYRYVGNSVTNATDPSGLEGRLWDWFSSWFDFSGEAGAAAYFFGDGDLTDGKTNRSRLAELSKPNALSSANNDLPDEYFRGPTISRDAANCMQQLAALGAGTYAGAFSRVGPLSQTLINKEVNFFRGHKKGFDHAVRQVNDFVEFSVKVPSQNLPGSYTLWVKQVNAQGRTVRLFHDTFDQTGKFIHRGIKVPCPERHAQ